MMHFYYNPEDLCWWGYAVDKEGNQIGEAQPGPTLELAQFYTKLFLIGLTEEIV